MWHNYFTSYLKIGKCLVKYKIMHLTEVNFNFFESLWSFIYVSNRKKYYYRKKYYFNCLIF